MSKTYLVELNHSDELPDVIRKCNTNFKNILFSSRNTVAETATGDIETEIDNLRQDMDSSFSEMTAALQVMNEKISAMKAALTPPVGSVLLNSADPSAIYENTTWTEIAGGTILMSAGTTYEIGSQLQLIDHSGTAVTISPNGSLITTCRLWRRTA